MLEKFIGLRKSGLIEAVRDLVNNSFLWHSNEAKYFLAQDLIEVPNEVKINTYRIVQEAINNIVKHSEAKQVDVSLNLLNNTLIVTIEDDGKGFESIEKNGSIGLKSMESRAAIMNGLMEIESGEGGTTITLRVIMK